MTTSNIGVPLLVGPSGLDARALDRVILTSAGTGPFDEAWLSRLIHDNPACLPIREIDPSLDAFTAICREMPTQKGPVDNLLMTGAGDIAIVETKLFRNPEARRQALAQALDYATSVFGMDYEAFERAALRGTYPPEKAKPTSLYSALPDAEKLDEAEFIDTISQNLRRGRVLILIAGDGIRSAMEELLDGVHAHSRFGFTLALVELGVFRMPDAETYLIRPRTLAKTAIVQRTIVEVIGGNAAVRSERLPLPETLGVNAYWQALEAKVPGARDALEELIVAMQPLGVYPDFLKSLNLKWQRPDQKPVNLGYIFKHASLWTDAAAWFAPKLLARTYVEELAAAFDCDMHPTPTGHGWTLYKNGSPVRIGQVLDRLPAWPPIAARFIESIRQHDAAAV